MLKQCPLCQENRMRVSRITCDCCALSVEGDIHVPPLARLTGPDMRLAEAFLLSGGNLKALAEQLGITYPTLRKRLDALIAEVAEQHSLDGRKIDTILSRIEAGEIDAEKGIRLIKDIRNEL